MAHEEQIEYVRNIAKSPHIKEFFGYGEKTLKVLDVGSGDINGNNREHFNMENVEEFIGCDIAEGPNVTIVSPGHKLTFKDGYFDTIISTECFEHDMCYPKTLQNIVRMLRPGGLFLFTCATTGRKEHGTRRKNPIDSFAAQKGISGWEDYYKNLTEEDIRKVLDVSTIFSEYKFSVPMGQTDLQFYGIKK